MSDTEVVTTVSLKMYPEDRARLDGLTARLDLTKSEVIRAALAYFARECDRIREQEEQEEFEYEFYQEQ